MQAWQLFQRRLFEKVRAELRHRLANQPLSLRRYEQRFRRDQRSLIPSTADRMRSSLRRAELVLVGDFHPLKQSQKFFFRLLKDPQTPRPASIALEVLPASLQALAQSARPRDLARLESELQLERIWGSSFDVYRDIFLWAKSNGVEVHGLRQPHRNLQERDHRCANTILSLPKPCWVLIGAYHCARPHLPAELRAQGHLGSMCIIQQDDDDLRLRQLRASTPSPFQIFKAKPKKNIDLFCVLHTPLWVKWQSFLRYQDSTGEADLNVELNSQLEWSYEHLQSFLIDPRYPATLNLPPRLEMEIITAEDPGFDRFLNKLPGPILRQCLEQLKSSRCAVLYELDRILMIETSLNSCAHAASLSLWSMLIEGSPPTTHFFSRVWVEAMLFFMSKILNHSRRTKHWVELEQNAKRDLLSRGILKTRNFPVHFADRHRWIQSLKPKHLECGRALGRVLADAAFEAFLVGEFSKSRLIRMLIDTDFSERNCFEKLVELQSVGKSFLRKEPLLW